MPVSLSESRILFLWLLRYDLCKILYVCGCDQCTDRLTDVQQQNWQEIISCESVQTSSCCQSDKQFHFAAAVQTNSSSWLTWTYTSVLFHRPLIVIFQLRPRTEKTCLLMLLFDTLLFSVNNHFCELNLILFIHKKLTKNYFIFRRPVNCAPVSNCSSLSEVTLMREMTK